MRLRTLLLKRLYQAKKKALGITQTSIADELGMKQGSVAQYMNGSIALNYEAVIRFAKVLQVQPWDIDPTLQVLKPQGEVTSREVTVEVQSTLTGSGKPQTRTITIRYDGMPDHLVGFEADTDIHAPFLRRGDIAVIDRSLQPEVGDDIVVEFTSDLYTVGELLAQSATEIAVRSYASGEERTKSLDEIKHYDVIVDVHKPKRQRARRLTVKT